MAYEFKGGEEVRNGILYGWTGKLCPICNGHGVNDENHNCLSCAGTGEYWGKMSNQPAELAVVVSE